MLVAFFFFFSYLYTSLYATFITSKLIFINQADYQIWNREENFNFTNVCKIFRNRTLDFQKNKSIFKDKKNFLLKQILMKKKKNEENRFCIRKVAS